MERTKARLGAFALTLAGGLACAVTAGASASTVNVGGFSGHATGGATASCFSETNGGVLNNGKCPGTPAWEIALPADATTGSITASLFANNAAAGSVLSLTSMMADDEGYSQVIFDIGDDSSPLHPPPYPVTAIGLSTVYQWSYLYCALKPGGIIFGVQYYAYSY